LEVVTSQFYGKTTYEKKHVDFFEFMKEVVQEYVPEQEIHVVIYNHSIHKGVGKWLEEYPVVRFHYTPTSASWSYMVEIWFGIFARKVLHDSSFTSVEDTASKVMNYIVAYEEDARLFIWKKREVVGSRLKDNITKLTQLGIRKRELTGEAHKRFEYRSEVTVYST